MNFNNEFYNDFKLRVTRVVIFYYLIVMEKVFIYFCNSEIMTVS